MHPCAALLEEAFSLLRLEKQAVTDKDMERVEALAGRRATLLLQAWENREGYDEDALRAKLRLLEEEQRRLQTVLDSLRAKLLAERRAGRKQARYFNGDRYVQSELQRSFYCDKIS